MTPCEVSPPMSPGFFGWLWSFIYLSTASRAPMVARGVARQLPARSTAASPIPGHRTLALSVGALSMLLLRRVSGTESGSVAVPLGE